MKRYYSHPEGYVRVKVDGKFVLEHRYLMEKHLGRKLRASEVVHHKDGNRANNRISNLELLSPSKHSKLHGVEREITMVTLVCPWCGEEFQRELYRVNYRKKVGSEMFCSRSCNGKANQVRQGGAFV